jgi:hypothetical protein
MNYKEVDDYMVSYKVDLLDEEVLTRLLHTAYDIGYNDATSKYGNVGTIHNKQDYIDQHYKNTGEKLTEEELNEDYYSRRVK